MSTVVSIEPTVSADPDKSGSWFINAIDDIITQSHFFIQMMKYKVR